MIIEMKKQERTINELFWEIPKVKKLRGELSEPSFSEQYEQVCHLLVGVLEQMDKKYEKKYARTYIDYIKWRVKTPESCIAKLYRKGRDITFDEAVGRLNDIAGVRVVCDFLDDMYQLFNELACDKRFTVIKQKDYVRSPKSSGYQSLHLIIGVPAKDGSILRAEVQFRTKAMDFWADVEHRFVYKNAGKYKKETEQELQKCARAIYKLDKQMMNIRNNIAD